MDYKGVVIEESLAEKNILKEVTILKTRREKVTSKHNTPWLTQWTLHRIEVPEDQMEKIAARLSKSFEMSHSAWYVDFKNDKFHFIIFPDKVFKVDLKNPIFYKNAREYGETLGIPVYQMQFERLKR